MTVYTHNTGADRPPRMLRVMCALVLAAGGCASGPETVPPPWAGNIRGTYPPELFITGLGEGASRADAEAKALGEISFYFVREIRAEQSSRTSWLERDGVSSSESQTGESILIESQTRLVAVRYAEDPWFNPAKKAWETVAYINRDEGWTAYEPDAVKQANAFMALVQAADEETEPFNRALRYGAAAAYGESAGYRTVREFAQALHPGNAGRLFAGADAASAELARKDLAAREQATVYIECPTDHERMIYQAMVKALGTAGFRAENSRNAAVVCLVRVEESAVKEDIGVFYFPTLSGTFSGANGALFSFRIAAERQGAMNPDLAKRRAYTALAAAVERSFANELNQARTRLVNQ